MAKLRFLLCLKNLTAAFRAMFPVRNTVISSLREQLSLRLPVETGWR
jgi:hypothetical protein